ncbi:MAG: hypothetical protein V4457_12850 [Pseudomonadota bacterium]
MKLLDANTAINANVDGLYQEHTQAIADDLLDNLKSERHAKAALRSGDYDRAASIPTFVVELWIRQGYDFYNMTAREIVAKLNADNLGAFIATPKRV